MDRSFKSRLAALEALEAAQNPGLPAFVCIHVDDLAAIEDPTLPAPLRQALADAYQLAPFGGQQKIYAGVCACAWDDQGDTCPVCRDTPLVRALA